MVSKDSLPFRKLFIDKAAGADSRFLTVTALHFLRGSQPAGAPGAVNEASSLRSGVRARFTYISRGPGEAASPLSEGKGRPSPLPAHAVISSSHKCAGARASARSVCAHSMPPCELGTVFGTEFSKKLEKPSLASTVSRRCAAKGRRDLPSMPEARPRRESRLGGPSQASWKTVLPGRVVSH